MKTSRHLFGYTVRPDEAVHHLSLILQRYANGNDFPRPTWMAWDETSWLAWDGEPWVIKEPRVLRTAVVRGCAWEELEWADTDIVSPDWLSGWLGPDGTWTGCSPVWHDVVAFLVLRTTAAQLERTHVRVRGPGEFADMGRDPPLTPQQRSWLIEHGHRPKPTPERATEELAAWVSASGRPLKSYGSGG